MSSTAPVAETPLAGRVRAEFTESAGLQLTEAQACRLFQLEPVVGASLLVALCEIGFLVKDRSGRFRKA
jgi:hypothetical protein